MQLVHTEEVTGAVELALKEMANFAFVAQALEERPTLELTPTDSSHRPRGHAEAPDVTDISNRLPSIPNGSVIIFPATGGLVSLLVFQPGERGLYRFFLGFEDLQADPDQRVQLVYPGSRELDVSAEVEG